MFAPGSLGAGPLVTAAAAAVLYGIVLVSLAYWVFLDARARGSDSPLAWGIAAGLTGVLVVPYLLVRGDRTRPRARDERFALTVLGATLGAWGVAALLAPPDPASQVSYVLGGLVVSSPLAYLMVYRRGA